jgi:hypothetical protein
MHRGPWLGRLASARSSRHQWRIARRSGAAALPRRCAIIPFELSPAWIRRKLYFIERFPLSPRHRRRRASAGRAPSNCGELLRQPQKRVDVALVLRNALRRGIDQFLALIRRRLAKLQIAFGVRRTNDLSRRLGGTGYAAQAIVEAGRAPGVIAAHDHRPDDEVMGGQAEIFDALSAIARALNPQPPLCESQIPVTRHLLGRSARQ